MKLLIIPGFPRCGTTYMWSEFKKSNSLFNFTKTQENKMMNKRGITLDQYFDSFIENHDKNKVYLDVTPRYIHHNAINRFLENYKMLESHFDVKMIISIRNPIEQAYSHYLHYILDSVSKLPERRLKRGWLTNFNFENDFLKGHGTFESERQDYLQSITKILEVVDREKILFHDFSDGFGEKFKSKIEKFIEKFIDIQLFKNSFISNQPVNSSGGKLPRYIYAYDKDISFVHGKHEYVLKHKNLLLINGGRSKVFDNMDTDIATKVICGSLTWDREISQDRAQTLLNKYFKVDIKKVSKLCNFDSKNFLKVSNLKGHRYPYLPDDFSHNALIKIK